MPHFLGEYICKIDSKGRLLLPSALKKQLSPESNERFVVNRGFEKCISLFPYDQWEKISEEINKLNLYVRKNRDFVRYFFRGANEISLDGSGRLLLPKSLLDYSGIGNELVLFAYSNRIEIWDPKTYDNLLTDEPENFARLAEEVMGKTSDPYDEDVS